MKICVNVKSRFYVKSKKNILKFVLWIFYSSCREIAEEELYLTYDSDTLTRFHTCPNIFWTNPFSLPDVVYKIAGWVANRVDSYQTPPSATSDPKVLGKKSHITKTRLFKYIENFASKNWNFLDKKTLIFFHISAQNIDCGYSLEPPRRGGSNEYPQSMFWAEIRKIMYIPVNPSFTI